MKRKKDRLAYVFLFSLISVVISSAYGIKEQIEYYDQQPLLWDQSPAWPTITGTIIASRVYSHHRYEDETLYRADVTYEYSVDSQYYVSDNLDFQASVSTDRNQAKDMVNKYPSGMVVLVYYDPDNPENAVLIPGCTGCRRSPLSSLFLMELIGLVLGTLVLFFWKSLWLGRW